MEVVVEGIYQNGSYMQRERAAISPALLTTSLQLSRQTHFFKSHISNRDGIYKPLAQSQVETSDSKLPDPTI